MNYITSLSVYLASAFLMFIGLCVAWYVVERSEKTRCLWCGHKKARLYFYNNEFHLYPNQGLHLIWYVCVNQDCLRRRRDRCKTCKRRMDS